MIEVKTKNGEIFVVKSPNLEMEESSLFREITSKFGDRNIRAISIELNNSFHTEKSITILCDKIEEITRR